MVSPGRGNLRMEIQPPSLLVSERLPRGEADGTNLGKSTICLPSVAWGLHLPGGGYGPHVPRGRTGAGGNMKGVAMTARLSFCGPGKVRSIGLTAPQRITA